MRRHYRAAMGEGATGVAGSCGFREQDGTQPLSGAKAEPACGRPVHEGNLPAEPI